MNSDGDRHHRDTHLTHKYLNRIHFRCSFRPDQKTWQDTKCGHSTIKQILIGNFGINSTDQTNE